MKNRFKYYILKYIRKYIPVFFAFVALPFLTVNSFAFDFFYNTVTTDFMQMRLESNVALNSGNVAPNDDYYYNFTNNSATGVRFFNTIFLATWDVMFDNENYDYYVSLIVDSQSSDNFTFRPDRINVRRLNDDGSYNDFRMEDFHIYEYDGWNTGGSSNGYRILAKFPDNFGFSIRGFSMLNDNLGSLPSDINISVVIMQTSKDTSADTVNSIVQAINNQTGTLGGKLDGIDSGIDKGNDLIENGTDETQQAVTDFNEVFEDFNTQLEEIESFETQFTDDFNTANETYLNELSNFTMPYGVINAGNWLSTSMQTVYDNADDYKMLWLVPLLLGVPLVIFFFKRGDNSE